MNVLTPRMAATLGVASGKGSRSEPPHDICACTHFAQRAPPSQNPLGASAKERGLATFIGMLIERILVPGKQREG